MTKKEFTKFELARMKRTAQNVEGFLKQKNKLEEKKTKIEEELAVINQQIELTDAPTVAMTGYHTEDIIKKVTFEFIYPDTIVPPVTDVAEEETHDKVEMTTSSDVEEPSEEITDTEETL